MKKLLAIVFAVSIVGPFACAAETNEESVHQASLTLTKEGASPTGHYTGDYRVDFSGRWDEVDARVRDTASTLERLSLVPGEKLAVARLSDGITTRAYELSGEAAKQISDVTSGFTTPAPSAQGPENVSVSKAAITSPQTKNACEACGGQWVGSCVFGFDSLCSAACIICVYECRGAISLDSAASDCGGAS